MKKPSQPKKVDPNLSQKDKFIAYAKEIEADDSGQAYNKAMSDIKTDAEKKDKAKRLAKQD